jgi:archaellum component FlaC
VVAIDSFTETAVEALFETGADSETIERVKSESEEVSEQFEAFIQQVEEVTRDHERLRNEHLLIPVVERVLLRYGLDPEVVDSMLDDMEAVDNQFRDAE